MRSKSLSGISTRFQALSQSVRQVTHVLLTRPPLTSLEQAPINPLDLHVLGTPPAFVLSQDQTLNKSLYLMARIVLLASYTRLVFKDQSCFVSSTACLSRRQEISYHAITHSPTNQDYFSPYFSDVNRNSFICDHQPYFMATDLILSFVRTLLNVICQTNKNETYPRASISSTVPKLS